MWSDRNPIYVERGGKKLLTAVDNCVIPVRSSAGVIDSPFDNGLAAHMIAVGTDIFQRRLTLPTGSIEPGEQIVAAALAENEEETGRPPTDTRMVHPRILTFYSYDTPEYPLRDDTTVENADIRLGEAYKHRHLIRTKSRGLPVQQPPKHGEPYPEMLNPKYVEMTAVDVPFHFFRKFCTYGLLKANEEEFAMLHTVHNSTAVEADLDQLRADYEAMHLHPVIIGFYCRKMHHRIISWQEELTMVEPVFKAYLENLEAAEARLHNMMTHHPRDEEVERMLRQTDTPA